MKKNFYLTTFLLIASTFLFAQTTSGGRSTFVIPEDGSNKSDYILLDEVKDTIFCYITEVERSAGNLTKIKYKDKADNVQQVKGKEVKSFRLNGIVVDKIPLKASKPDSYQRHIEAKINGKIKIYDHIRLVAMTNKKGERKLYSVVGPGSDIYTIKLDNGQYYDISNSNIKKYIAPYLQKCKNFKSAYNGEYNTDTIEEIVLLYNKECK